MKYIFLLFIFLVSVGFGYFYSRKYRIRVNFFRSLVMLCQKFDVEINFSRARVRNILLSIDEKTKNKLCRIDNNYLLYLEGQNALTREELFNGINFLKENEKDIIYPFFNLLGKTDVDSQSKEIKNYQSRFESFYEIAEADNKKYGVLSFKLGIITGLFLIVIFL